jgi:hypothetical protein
MSVEQLGTIAGVVLSLGLAYIPKLKDWYETRSAAEKVQIMGALLLGSALAVFGLSCANVFSLVQCSEQGAKELFGVLIAALVANQASFVMFVKPFKSDSVG